MNIFITGVSQGFGKELARHYLDLGHKVFGFSKGILDENRKSDKMLLDSENFKFVCGSVNNDDDVNRAFEEAIGFLGTIDVLINNAAFKIFKLPDEISDTEYREAVQTNLLAPILLCGKVLPLFLKQNRGCIINMSSNAGMVAYKEGTAYCSSKAGLISYTLSLADFFKGKNISVNVISPPTFSTEDYRKNFPDVNHKKLLQSEDIIKLIDHIVFNKKLISGKNFPLFKFKTFSKYVLKKNIEFISYLFQHK